MKRRRLAMCAAFVLLSACASSPRTSSPLPSLSPAPASSSTTSSPQASTPDTGSGTSVATSEIANAARFTLADVPSNGPCVLAPPSAAGQITFVIASRLYGVAADGTLQCLADLQGLSPTWLRWSPNGDELLVGPDTMLRADGSFASTGYFANNINLRWSSPTGKALIAPKAATGQLIWRDAHDSTNRIDVSFADNITSAAYHPAGKHIAVAGIGRDGQGPGVFVASNRGANAQRIGTLEAGTTATEVAFDMTGDSLVFVHQHADGSSHLHRYTFANSTLLTLAELPDTTPTQLTVSPVDEGDVAWTQSYSTVNSSARLLLGDSTTTAVVANSPEGDHISDPIGWLPGHRLLVNSRSPAVAADGAFELWEWSPTGMSKVIDGVTAAAARSVHGQYNELTAILGSGFG